MVRHAATGRLDLVRRGTVAVLFVPSSPRGAAVIAALGSGTAIETPSEMAPCAIVEVPRAALEVLVAALPRAGAELDGVREALARTDRRVIGAVLLEEYVALFACDVHGGDLAIVTSYRVPAIEVPPALGARPGDWS